MKQFLDNLDTCVIILDKKLNPVLCNKRLLNKLEINNEDILTLKISVDGKEDKAEINKILKNNEKIKNQKLAVRLITGKKTIELESKIVEDTFLDEDVIIIFSDNVNVINFNENIENTTIENSIKKEINETAKCIERLNKLLDNLEKDQDITKLIKVQDLKKGIEVMLGEIYKSKLIKKDFELLLGISVDLVGSMAINGQIKTSTIAWSKCLGWDEKELLNFNILDIIHEKDKDSFMNILISSDEEVKTVENKIKCKNNTYKCFRWRIKLIKERETFTFTIRDITKDVEEQEKRKQLEDAVALESIKNEFFANMSHEFKTPLNIILGTMQLLTKNYSNNNIVCNNNFDLEKYLKLIKQNSYRLLRLVNNLIDMTRIDNGYYEVRLGNHDIVKIVEDITLSVAQYIEGNGINLIFDTNYEEYIVACDPEKIERILLNLLSNSIKYTKQGGYIHVNLNIDKHNINISVKDNGEGIVEEKLPIIFNRFVQGNHILARPCEGSGIGLSLVKSLVEMHDGNIDVKSKVGLGTEFQFHIPNKKIDSDKYKSIIDASTEGNKIEKCNIEFSDIYGV
ncbi:ATP-binding protein [Romboutsia lituseburensis]|uniref:ATP-binding protein n=1 Tax=Romboutsia lituseburensis TaxID=1537 RepID=UPI00215AB1AD|nr:ATP-binding protein [Romboutsia lituseburensis]MCR8743809.1 ATP-binding protein [Romboutsia lituseburensis]